MRRILPRKFLFEFEDYSWYPSSFRNVQTDFLQFLMSHFDVFKNVYPKLFTVSEAKGIFHFTDLCSGGGGAILQLRKHFNANFTYPFSATLSDLYPNITAYRAINQRTKNEVNYVSTPVDIAKDISSLEGFWTIFNAFHHLSPLSATRLLRQAVINKKPIAILEPLDSNLLVILFQSLVLILVLLLVIPFMKSFNLKVFIFSYLLPLIPLAIIWDGWISAMRVYRTSTLQRMTKIADKEESYHWIVDEESHTFGKVLYLVGYSKV